MALALPGTGFILISDVLSSVGWIFPETLATQSDSFYTSVSITSLNSLSEDLVIAGNYRISNQSSAITTNATSGILASVRLRARKTTENVFILISMDYTNLDGTPGTANTTGLTLADGPFATYEFDLVYSIPSSGIPDLSLASDLNLRIAASGSGPGGKTIDIAWVEVSVAYQRLNLPITVTGQGSN